MPCEPYGQKGPVTGYLRWHAWTVYGWKPDLADTPQMPVDYNNIRWRYLPKFDAPGVFIGQQVAKRNNERVRRLRPIMDMGGVL